MSLHISFTSFRFLSICFTSETYEVKVSYQSEKFKNLILPDVINGEKIIFKKNDL